MGYECPYIGVALPRVPNRRCAGGVGRTADSAAGGVARSAGGVDEAVSGEPGMPAVGTASVHPPGVATTWPDFTRRHAGSPVSWSLSLIGLSIRLFRRSGFD